MQDKSKEKREGIIVCERVNINEDRHHLILLLDTPTTGVFDINCNIGSSAIAAIRRTLYWAGVEEKHQYRAYISEFLGKNIGPEANKDNAYFLNWRKSM